MGQTTADAGSAAATGKLRLQFHIYDVPGKFPPRANRPYPPIESATFAEAQNMHKAIGFDRGVIVHSAIYGSDHRLLLHALESLNDRERYRGIGIVDDKVSDKELARMHAAGVCGPRFNFVRFLTARGGSKALDGPASRARLARAIPRTRRRSTQ